MDSVEREEAIFNDEISFINITYFIQSLLEQSIPILKWGGYLLLIIETGLIHQNQLDLAYEIVLSLGFLEWPSL